MSFLGYFLQGYWERGTEPERPGSGHESLCPCEAFETADQPLILGVANDALWRNFCAVAGLQSIVDDPRFRSNSARVAHREQTVAIVHRALSTQGRDAWLAALNAAGFPCSPLHTLRELSRHPHTAASEMVREHTDARYGALRSVSQSLRFDGERTAVRSLPPALGADGRTVLRAAGYSDDQIDKLAQSGALSLPCQND